MTVIASSVCMPSTAQYLRLPHAPGHEREHAGDEDRADRDVPAARRCCSRTRARRGSRAQQRRDDRADGHRRRPLAGLQRLQRGPRRLVLGATAGVAALEGVAADGGLGVTSVGGSAASPPACLRASRRPSRSRRCGRAALPSPLRATPAPLAATAVRHRRRSSAARSSAAAAVGIGGVADRPHDADSSRSGRGHLMDGIAVDPSDGEPRALAAGARGVADVVEAGGAAARLRRRLVHRPHAQLVGLRRRARLPAAPASASRGRSARPGPTRSRTAATGSSSWPTCTPSAPAASARSGRSLSHSSAPCSSQARRKPAAAAQERLVVGVLVAQLHHVDAAAQRGV